MLELYERRLRYTNRAIWQLGFAAGLLLCLALTAISWPHRAAFAVFTIGALIFGAFTAFETHRANWLHHQAQYWRSERDRADCEGLRAVAAALAEGRDAPAIAEAA